jgi:hypothetical protein
MEKISKYKTKCESIQRTKLAPVVLFVYSRLEHTKRTIEALKLNKEAVCTELYIFCDAPNPRATEEQITEIYATHEYLRTIKEGFGNINLELSEVHRGAGKAIIRGISIVLAKHGRCIILENDMEVEPLFLEYMNKGLEAYKNDKRIYGIASTSYKFQLPRWYKKKLFLLKRPQSWGWATWLDRWQNVDWDVKDFEKIVASKRMQKLFNTGGNDLYYMLKDQMEGRTDTWDLQWAWHIFKQKGYFAYSRWSFQKNCGFDGSGAHCGNDNQIQNFFAPLYPHKSLEVDFTILKPNSIIIKRFRDFYNKHISFIRKKTLKTRIKIFLKRMK